jgi:N-glycosylase/DNA lyase
LCKPFMEPLQKRKSIMKIAEIDQGLLLKEVPHFDARHIFECGQCFRWKREEDGSYTGVAYGRVLNVKSDYDRSTVVLKNTNRADFENIWYHYFDLRRDYGVIKKALWEDEILKEAIHYGRGIRILNQEPWELALSFIISSNNNIPRITKSIGMLAALFGQSIPYGEETYYSFPTLEALKNAQLEQMDLCRMGYRCKYIHQTVKMLAKGELNLSAIGQLDTAEARQELLKLPGVGPKVADCILLFSMGKYEVYPTDVWVKRVTEHFYIHKEVPLKRIQQFAGEKFGLLAGFAQQYLFYYAREQRIR